MGDNNWESAEFVIGDIEGNEEAKSREMPWKFFQSVVLEEDGKKTLNLVEVGVF